MKRSFKIDVERCDSCGGRMKLRAFIVTAAGIERRAAHRLNEPAARAGHGRCAR